MNPNEEKMRLEQKVNRLERQYARTRIQARKAETRRKIELGGLVIKSGMDKYPKSVILGALLDICAQIENDWQQHQLFLYKGEQAFLKK